MKKKTVKDYYREVKTFDELWFACRELEDSEPGALPLVYIPKGLTPAQFFGWGIKNSKEAAEKAVASGEYKNAEEFENFVSHFGGGYLFKNKQAEQ